MKKILSICSLIMIIITSLLMFGGCGKNPFEDEKDGELDVEGKTTVRVMAPGDDPAEKTLVQKFKADFEKVNSKINIYIETYNGAFQNEMLRMISSKTLPDIIWMGGNVHANFSSNGHFVNLKPYFEKDKISLDNMNKISLDSTHYNFEDEGIWFAPRDYNKVVTYVNTEMLEAAGIAMPAPEDFDLDMFMSMCKTLREKMDKDTDRPSGLYRTNYPLSFNLGWDPIYKTLLASQGATDYNRDGTLGLETREAELAYKLCGELYQRRYAITPSTTESDYFVSKKVAFSFGVRPYMATAINAKIPFNVLPLPFGKSGAGCSGYGITSVSKVKDEAWEFLKYIMSERGQNIFGDTGMGVPADETLWEKGSWKDYKVNDTFNHQVFVMNKENDVDLNSINVYKPANHLAILQNTAALFVTLKNKSTWKGSPLADQSNIKDNAWKGVGNWNTMKMSYAQFLTVLKSEIAK